MYFWHEFVWNNTYINKLDLRIREPILYPPERQLTTANEPLFDLEGGAKGQI